MIDRLPRLEGENAPLFRAPALITAKPDTKSDIFALLRKLLSTQMMRGSFDHRTIHCLGSPAGRDLFDSLLLAAVGRSIRCPKSSAKQIDLFWERVSTPCFIPKKTEDSHLPSCPPTKATVLNLEDLSNSPTLIEHSLRPST